MKSKKFIIKKNKLGKVYKIISRISSNFKGFGELYISSIKPKKTKGWNLHKKMTLNIVLIQGKVQISERYKGKVQKIILNQKSNKIVTIKPLRWVKLKNLYHKESKIINFANLLHNKKEQIKK